MRRQTMIRFLNLAGLFLVLLRLCTACENQTPEVYSGPNGISFDTRTSGKVLLDTTSVTFVYQSDETEYMDVAIEVLSTGWQSDEDRPVNITVWSDNAVENVDYELITPAVLPAKTSRFSYVVRLRRTAALKGQMKTLYLKLGSNDYFSTFLTQEATGNEKDPYTSKVDFRIDFSDFYSTPPIGWLPEYVGEFSERKLRLLWKLFDDIVPRENYNIKGAIPFNQWIYMRNEVDLYLDRQYYILVGWETGEVDPDALVDPTAQGDDRRLLDFTPITSN